MRIADVFFPIGKLQVSLSYHQSLTRLFSAISMDLLLCRGTWLPKLVVVDCWPCGRHFVFYGVTAGVRYGMIFFPEEQ